MKSEIKYFKSKFFNKIFFNRIFSKKEFIKKCFIKQKFEKPNFDENGQAGAEMILLIGGMIVIVLIAIYFYKNYLLGIGDEMNSTELSKLDQSIKNISSKFN